jgi:hypothetical protein
MHRQLFPVAVEELSFKSKLRTLRLAADGTSFAFAHRFV